MMKGKILLINFIYTDCDAICPLMTEILARAQELLGLHVCNEFGMVSISLRSEHDTPEAPAANAKTHGAGPGWMSLTGEKDDIELLRHLIFPTSLRSWPLSRSCPSAPRIANEPLHRWAVSPALLSPATLIREVNHAGSVAGCLWVGSRPISCPEYIEVLRKLTL
jgi:protein SCO1